MLQPSFVPQASAVAAPQFAAPQLNVQRPDNPFDAPEGVKLRAVGDVGALRESIYDSVLRAASEMPEVVGNQNTLRLTDLHYAEDDPEFDAADEKKAILSGSSLSRRLRGTWNLIDNATGESISSRKATVANVPAILRDGSFLRNGTRYAMGYQQRLKPGAYARYKKSGEPEVHINAASGSGRSHRYVLEPETGLFHVHIEHAKIPLVPLLQTLGVTREQIESAWGKELTDKNFAKQDSKAVNKLYERFVSKHEQNAEDKAVPERVAAKIQQAIASIKLDPEVVDNTLGRASDTLDGDLILKGTSKALRMLQGQEDADDRDNLAFASYHGAADIFAERFMKDYGKFRRELLYKAGRKGTLDSLPSGALDKYINAAIFRSGLGQAVEDINPIEIAATRMKITRFGEGGLADATSAPAESRDVHPSQFGYVDGVTTPECQPGYCQVMTREGWVPWSILRDDQELACMIDGRLEWHKPVRVIRKPYIGEMVHTEMRRLVDTSTPGHRMWVRPVGHGLPYRFEPASKLLAGASRNVMCGGHLPYVGDTSVTRYVFGLPGTNRARPQADTFAIDDWAAFLGWYLSEGNTVFVRTQRGGVNVSNVGITKVKSVWPEQYAEIASLLERMGLHYRHKKSGRGMEFSSIPIAEYLSQFGKSHEKSVPDCVFDWPVLARQAFVRAITMGDGRRARDGRVDSYSSTSIQLVKDVQRLLFGLGVSTSQITVTPDDRSETYHDLFEIHIHKCDERSIQQRNGKKYCQPLAYSGMVYCAEVLGGLIYTRHPDSPSGIWTGNSLRIGIDGFLAANSMIGSDNKLYAKMIDNKTGQQVVRSPDKLLRSSVSLGNAPMEGYEMVSVRGRLRMLPKGTAEYSMPNMEDSFSVLGNMVPMKGNMFGQRASMGARMASQAMALETPQAPWVQTGTPDDLDESFEERFGKQLGAIRSEERGRVVELGPDHVTVKYAGGREQRHVLDNNRPGARKSIFHQTPMVELGQEVEPNQLLVKSNYVDDKGVAAMGINARTALMAWPDAWEDGIVVSQSFADRTRIQQAYKYKIQPGEGEKVDKRGYLQLFGNRYKSEQLANIGNDGVIKVGTMVKEGDPLMLGMRKRDGAKTRVHKQSKMDWGDSSVRWDHAHEGVVTDVFHSDKGSQVVVKTAKPLEESDKLAGRFGNKGVITIKPDSEMPHDQEGNPIELIVSPLAVPSRGNSSFPLELLLGKIAAKRGAPFKIKDFRGNDLQQMAMAEAEANGVNDTETLIDPKTGRKIPGVLTGQSFVMALHHLASSKSSARGLGTYSADDSPARGGEEGAQAKRYSGQMAWAGMSHGAYNMSREATLLRGVRNDDYWNAFMGGEQIAPPRISPQYDAFVSRLQASGINPIRSGTKTQLMAMIDADVDDLAGNRIVTSPDTVDVHKDLKPLPNGLFDPKLFGDGTRWAAIQLSEPSVNPAFEEPLRRMLGLTEKEFREVLGGKKELGNFGSGPDGLKKRLDSMDIDQEITKAREAIAGTRKVARDEAVKRLKYLKALKDTDTRPSDLMITKVPVLPPRLRPISKLGGKGGVVVSDPNFLYRELMFANEVVNDLKGSVDDLSSERLAVYDAHRALVGLTDPASRELRQRKVKGLIKQITGDNPKSGVVQRKLISGNVDTVGRGVIAPDTSLDMDSFGLPENLAFDMYQPYIVRNMALRGIPRVAALEHLKNRDDVARRSLLAELDKRPVTLSRAPILHKYGDIALMPRLIKGDAIRLNPLVYGPLGGDNDGDAVNLNIPHSREAVSEAFERMLPSKMLVATSNFKSPMFKPTQDLLLGLHIASKPARTGVKTQYFGTLADAKAALNRGDIDVDTPVKIGDRPNK